MARRGAADRRAGGDRQAALRGRRRRASLSAARGWKKVPTAPLWKICAPASPRCSKSPRPTSPAAAATIGRSRPRRTATGRPLVAGDPHRVLEMPNMYAQTHIACDEFDVIGLTVPGVPGFPHFGAQRPRRLVRHPRLRRHSRPLRRALLRPTARAACSRARGSRCGRGARRSRCAARRRSSSRSPTTRHGPIIVGDPRKGSALALRSMQFTELDRSFDALLPMMRAPVGGDALRGDARMGADRPQSRRRRRRRARSATACAPKCRAARRRTAGCRFPAGTASTNGTASSIGAACPAAIDPPGRRDRHRQQSRRRGRRGLPLHRRHAAASRAARLAAAGGVERRRRSRTWPRSIATSRRPRALELRERLRPRSRRRRARRRRRCASIILDWDGRMERGLAGRHRLQRRPARADQARGRAKRARRGGEGPALRGVSPGLMPENQLWWTVPGLLRNDDRSMLKGATWEELLAEALIQAAASPLTDWASAHQPRLAHPLSALFPEQAGALDRASRAGRGRQRHGVCNRMRRQRRRARRLRVAVALCVRRRRLGELALDRLSRRVGRAGQSLAHEPERRLGAMARWFPCCTTGRRSRRAASRQRLLFRDGDVYVQGPERRWTRRLRGTRTDAGWFEARRSRKFHDARLQTAPRGPDGGAVLAEPAAAHRRTRGGDGRQPDAGARGDHATRARRRAWTSVRANRSPSRTCRCPATRSCAKSACCWKGSPRRRPRRSSPRPNSRGSNNCTGEFIAAEKSGDSETATLANFHFIS